MNLDLQARRVKTISAADGSNDLLLSFQCQGLPPVSSSVVSGIRRAINGDWYSFLGGTSQASVAGRKGTCNAGHSQSRCRVLIKSGSSYGRRMITDAENSFMSSLNA